MFLDIAFEPPTPVTSNPSELLLFMPLGYLLTVLIEAPILLAGLSRSLTWRQRLFAGFWLTACTYPVVVLILPIVFASSARETYLLVAETFAPIAECVLFWLAFRHRIPAGLWSHVRNFGTIILANILSFIAGEIVNALRWFGLL